MKKTALIYSQNTQKTARAAKMIQDAFNGSLEEMNVENITKLKFLDYEQAILGVPTWFDGELPNYWDEFLPDIEDEDLSGKMYALYGLGDQKGYPENFVDAMGILADFLAKRGAAIVGFVEAEDYEFESSRAFKDGKFCGLPLDFENQPRKNNTRVSQWVLQLNKEFNM